MRLRLSAALSKPGARWFFPDARGAPHTSNPAPALSAIPGAENFADGAPVTGDDVFWNLHWSESRDLGNSWSEPKPLPGLARLKHPNGITEELLADAGPDHHAPTDTVIILGDNVYYGSDGKTQTQLPGSRWQQPVYMTGGRDGKWSAPRKLDWDDARGSGTLNAGNSQRVTLPGGDILLALSHAPKERSAMVRWALAVSRTRDHTIAECRWCAARSMARPWQSAARARSFVCR